MPWVCRLCPGQHEAGHFLTAYLLGVLPASYDLQSRLPAAPRGAQRTAGGDDFCGCRVPAAGAKLTTVLSYYLQKKSIKKPLIEFQQQVLRSKQYFHTTLKYKKYKTFHLWA